MLGTPDGHRDKWCCPVALAPTSDGVQRTPYASLVLPLYNWYAASVWGKSYSVIVGLPSATANETDVEIPWSVSNAIGDLLGMSMDDWTQPARREFAIRLRHGVDICGRGQIGELSDVGDALRMQHHEAQRQDKRTSKLCTVFRFAGLTTSGEVRASWCTPSPSGRRRATRDDGPGFPREPGTESLSQTCSRR